MSDRRRNPQSGEWEDYPNFIDCVVFGARADALSRFLTKGTKVAIDGRLRYDAWQDQSGNRRSRIQVVCENIDFMSRGGAQPDRPVAGQQSSYRISVPAQQPQHNAPQPAAAPIDIDDYDQDIPF